jgi:hypothetical protein
LGVVPSLRLTAAFLPPGDAAGAVVRLARGAAVPGRGDRRSGLAPPDYQQGDGFRIIYVHAPAAWLSLMVYVVMATRAAVGLIWRMTVAYAVAASCAVIGASFTAVALATGMLWGRPMWGTYWEWDPRLTSELLLLFLYLGYMGLRNAIDDISGARIAPARCWPSSGWSMCRSSITR